MEFKAYLSGLGVLLIFWILYRLLLGTWSPSALINGEDGKASTSKFQWFLWTIVVVFSFIVVYAARVLTGNYEVIPNIPQNLLIVMGFSITSMVAAKGITSAYVKSGQLMKLQSAPGQTGLSWVIKDDGGQPDLSKVQIMAWTLIGVGVYLIRVVEEVHTGSSLLLPDIDPALMVLMGLGHGAYLGKKIVTTNDSSTRLGRAVPIAGRPPMQGQTIMQYQSSVMPPAGQATPPPPGNGTSSQPTSVVSQPPPAPSSSTPPATNVAETSQPSSPPPGAALPSTPPVSAAPTPVIPPHLTGIIPAHGSPGTTVVLTGTGFGPTQNGSFITLDDLGIYPDGVTWSDTQVTFPFPAQGGTGVDWVPGETVQVGLVVGGVKSGNMLLFGVK